MRLGLFGLPGAGKGTQAERMAKRWSIPHISTGDMFRDIQNGESPLAKEIRSILASGALVSDEVVTKLAFDRLGQADCSHGFILDGYPRTLTQAQDLQASPFALDHLIVIDVERSEIVRRLSGRRVCGQCKAVYGINEFADANDRRCPKDGAVLIQRADDMPEAVATRLELFERNFLPVLEFYQGLGLLGHINGLGSPDEVFERITGFVHGMSTGVRRCN